MKKKVNKNQNPFYVSSERYSLSVTSNGFVTISRRGFGILIPDSLKISEAVDAFNDAKAAQDLFFTNFKK